MRALALYGLTGERENPICLLSFPLLSVKSYHEVSRPRQCVTVHLCRAVQSQLAVGDARRHREGCCVQGGALTCLCDLNRNGRFICLVVRM